MAPKWLQWVVILACLSSPAVTDAQTPRWTALGPNSGTVFALARDPFNSRVLLAGTYFGGLYRSEDGGLRWEYIPSALASLPVLALAFDPVHEGVVYAGTFQSGVFRSTDQGRTWVSQNTGLRDLTVRALALDPIAPDVLIAAGDVAIYRSTTGAADWTPVFDVAATAILFDPQRPGVVYAGTAAQGVLRSGDGGLSWSADNLNVASTNIAALTYDAREGGAVLASGDGRAYRRNGADPAWENLSDGLPFSRVSEVSAEPGGDRLFAVTDSGIFSSPRQAPTNWTLWTSVEFDRPARRLVFDVASSLAIVVLEHGGLFASSDGGVSWVSATRGMHNVFVGGLAIATAGGQTIRYAGTDLGVYVGSTAFDTATETNWYRNGGFREGIFKILPHPTQSGVVFAGTERAGVWKSTDFGTTWTQASNGLVPLRIYDIAQSSLDPDTVYTAGSSGLHRSRDRGRTWTASATRQFNPTYIFSVAVDPVRPGTAYFGSVDGLVFKTVDDGKTFFQASNGLPSDYIMELRITWAGAIYALTASGVLYASADSGSHWFPAQTGITAPIHTVEIADPKTLYAGTFGGGVFKSATGGSDWQPTASLPFPYVFSLAVDPHASRTIYAGTLGVFKSTDGGTSWRGTSAGLPNGAVTDIEVDAVDSQLVYVAIQDQGIFQSSDGGATWSLAAMGLPSVGMIPIHADVSTTRRVFAAPSLSGVFVSDDAGRAWTPSNRGLSVFVRGLAMNAQQPSTMYAGALLGGIFKTTDGGESWRNTGLNDNQILDIAVHPYSADVVYVATTQGVMLSTDGGDHWTSLGPRSGTGYGIFTLAVAIHPDYPQVVYAATGGEGVFRSENAGIEWTAVNGGLDNRLILALLIDPRRPNTLYAATAGSGVYVTDNGGFSWSVLGEGLFTGIVTSLAVDPESPQTVYAGTEGGGVFRLSR